MRILSYISLMAFLSGCTWADDTVAVKAVQDIFHAERAFAGSGTKINAAGNKIDYKVLTLKSGAMLNDSAVGDIDIISISALVFYGNLTSQALRGKEAIKVAIERNFSGEVREVERFYYIDTLRMADSIGTLYEKFCRYLTAGDYDKVYAQFATDLQETVPRDSFITTCGKMDSLYGAPISHVITEFDTWNGKILLEGIEVKGIRLSADMTRDSLVTRINVTYGLPPVKGIIKLHIGQHEHL